MHDARAGDDHAVEQIRLLMAARLDAGRACPDDTTALLEILDHGGERLERRDLGEALAALADKVDRSARQEDRHLEAGGQPAVGDGEGDGR